MSLYPWAQHDYASPLGVKDHDSARKLSAIPPSGSGIRERAGTVYALRYRGRDLPLLKHEIVIGRSASCDLVLDSQLVSRRHACVHVGEKQASVSDLGSRNGVLVNGKLIEGETLLDIGDRVSIGEEQLEVVEQHITPERERVTAQNLRSKQTVSFAEVRDEVEDVQSERTRRADAFTLLGGVVDKALALGRGEEAERLLGGHLTRVLDDASRSPRFDRSVAPVAARYAIKLAGATGKPTWVDYAIRLYRAIGEPLPLPVVDEMYGLLRRVRGVDRALLREYLAVLRTRASSMSAADRFSLQRIEGLERLAAL